MDPENYQLTRNDFELCAKNAFKNLLGEEDFSDVTLACSDNKQVKAHKVILGACSPFFKQILLRNPHQHPLIYLKGISSDDLEAIIKFIYQGQTSISETNLDSFLASAQELQVEGLLLAKNETTTTQKNTEKQLIVPKKEMPEYVENIDQPEELETIANYLKSGQVEPPSKPGEKKVSSQPNIHIPTSVNKFKCDLCDFESLYRKSIKRHKENVHQVQTKAQSDEIPLTSINARSPSPSLSIENHVLEAGSTGTDQSKTNLGGYAFENENYKCDNCDFATKHKWNMKRHVDRVHQAVIGLVSKHVDEHKDTANDDSLVKDLLVSDSSFNSENSFSLANSAPNSKSFYEEKNNVMDQTSDPDGIEVNLENEKQQCDYCDFSTTHKRNLRRHVQRLHLNDGIDDSKNDAVLPNNEKLVENNVKVQASSPRSVLGPKTPLPFTYTCDKCDFTSDNKWNLTRHILRVHKEMKYPCDYCDYKAPQTYRLKEHMQKKHR